MKRNIENLIDDLLVDNDIKIIDFETTVYNNVKIGNITPIIYCVEHRKNKDLDVITSCIKDIILEFKPKYMSYEVNVVKPYKGLNKRPYAIYELRIKWGA